MRRHAADEPSRWDEDNRLQTNPWAFVAIAGIVGVLAAIAVLLALL